MTPIELRVDANSLQVTFSVRWFGVLRITGRFGRADGQLTVAGEEAGAATVAVAVDASSVTTGLSLRDRHLRAERFLHADLHPWIRFASTMVTREAGELVVQGLLTLRGVSTPVRAACPLDEVQRDGEQVVACARFVVSRSRHVVGVPPGVLRYNPMFLAIADDVHVHVRLRLPALIAERVGLPVQGARPRAATGHDDST